MTDNEKAATFIGWNPTVQCYCASKGLNRMNPEHADLPIEHSMSAPDMSDPRNYMKALEAIQARTNHGPIELRLSCERDDDWKPTKYVWDMRLYKVLEDEHTVDWASPVKALALLYDAEHDDDAE